MAVLADGAVVLDVCAVLFAPRLNIPVGADVAAGDAADVVAELDAWPNPENEGGCGGAVVPVWAAFVVV